MPTTSPSGTKVGSKELKPSIPYEWQETNHLSCHGCLPESAMAGSWSQKPEPGVEPTWDAGVLALGGTPAPVLSALTRIRWFTSRHETGYFLCSTDEKLRDEQT